MRSRHLLLPLALALGCDRPAPPAASPSISTRDSAGITIITNTAPAWDSASQWTVGGVTLDLGAPDGAFQGFVDPTGAVELSDGRLVVADAGADLLYFFGKEGRFLYHVGSPGQAAGQFQSLWGVLRGAGDTVIAYDLANSRLTRFDPNGALIDTLSIAVPPGSNGYLPVGRTPRGVLVLLRNETAIPFPGPPWSVAMDSGEVVRFSSTGSPVDSIGPIPVGELIGLPVPKTGGGSITVPVNRPLGRQARVAIVGDTTWIGLGATPTLTGYLNGTPRVMVVLPGALTITPDSLITQFTERRRAAGSGRGFLDSIFTASLDSIHFPDYLPAHGAVIADAAGDLWVQDPGLGEMGPGDGSRRWRVIGPDGRWLGTVTLPPRLAVREIGSDHVLGAVPSDSGRPHLLRYALQKPAGAR